MKIKSSDGSRISKVNDTFSMRPSDRTWPFLFSGGFHALGRQPYEFKRRLHRDNQLLLVLGFRESWRSARNKIAGHNSPFRRARLSPATDFFPQAVGREGQQPYLGAFTAHLPK
jgi:hypothetical protein